jgi:hypothetical protein
VSFLLLADSDSTIFEQEEFIVARSMIAKHGLNLGLTRVINIKAEFIHTYSVSITPWFPTMHTNRAVP